MLSFISGVVHVSLSQLLGTFQLPAFTSAFNVVMCAFLVGVESKNITVLSLRSSKLTSYPNHWTDMSINFIIEASIKGVGQFMFIDTIAGGVFVIAGD